VLMEGLSMERRKIDLWDYKSENQLEKEIMLELSYGIGNSFSFRV
jgi:hypothetical protein